MKKKFLLPILLLATLTMGGAVVACNNNNNNSNNTAASQYKVAIDNKAALEGEWYEGESKDLELTLTPEANPLQELQNKNLTVTSSDEAVVKVTGLGLSALKDGAAKITVNYRGAKEEVNVTILSKSAKAKYGTAHEGTAEDPFSNEDALLVTKSAKYANEDYYVKGEVASWYHTPGERTDGVVSYFLKPATAGGEQFEVYKCLKEDGKALSETEIWKGGIATAHGTFTKYGEQCETTSAKFVKCEGTAPSARQVVNATVAEVLAVGKALVDGDSEYNFYNITGYVVKKSGTSYFLADTKAVAEDSKNMFQIYNATAEGLDAKLLENAKITVKAVIKNYHGQVETCLPVANDDVTVLEAGQKWSVPEPAVVAKTIAEFKALENNKKNAYTVKGTIKAFKSGETKDEYGNMTLTDGTNDLAIYGATATETALAWDNAEAYAFTNPKDFMTNSVTKDLKIGDEITMKLIRSDYVKDGETKAIQGQGIITAVKGADAPEVVSLAKYTFKTQTEGNTRSIDAATATNVFQKAADDAVFDEVKEVTNIYEGASGGSGDNAFSVFDVLKIGKSKAAGSIKFATKVDVTKVFIKGVSWTQTSSLTVNGVTVNEAFKANIISKATIVDGKINNAGTLEFEFAAAKEITISNDNTNANANFGIVFTEIELFGQAAAQ